VVICDTTVLIALARIGYLWLQKELWNAIVVPEAVYQEASKGVPGNDEIAQAVKSSWLQVGKVQNQKMVLLLQGNLRGKGECECIILAQETGAKIILTDDKKARKIASQGGFQVIGTLGLLVMATQEKIITKQDAAQAVNLLAKTNFRLSDGIIQKALNLIENI
jgi:predicted nucleic acid-binding protein